MHRKFVPATLASLLAISGGCVVDAPFNPDGVLGGLTDNVEDLLDDITDAAADPLGAKPFPRLLAGGGDQLFYSTNLTDLRIRFRGPGNDLAIPSVVGPTNIYQLVEGQREVVSLLQPTLGVIQMDTDGRFLVAVQVFDITGGEFRTRVVAEDLSTGDEFTLFEPAGGDAFALEIAVANGRAAYSVLDVATETVALRIAELRDRDAAETEIPIGSFSILRMRGDRLAFVDRTGDAARLTVRDLARDETQVIAESRSQGGFEQHFLTSNKLVWSDLEPAGRRVSAFDFVSGETAVVGEALGGVLRGASDQFLLLEGFRVQGAGRGRISVIRRSFDGQTKQLAEFDADGFAGQSRIVADDAVWVNPERRIAIQPLAGGERRIVKPF